VAHNPAAWNAEFEKYTRIRYSWTLGAKWPRLAMVQVLLTQAQYLDPVVNDWEHITAPTLVFGGADDMLPGSPAVFQQRMSFVAGRIPNARLHLIPGLGHVPHLEAPEKTYPPLVAFLKEGLAGAASTSAQTHTAPRYEADVNWPKPLPNRWVLGGLGGTCVDARGHVFILNRQDVLEGELNTGRLAPPIIEFDPDGNVVNSWGDPKLLDPRLHSCHVDKDGNVWVASAPSGMVQKYTHDGSKLLLQIGKKGVVDSSDGTVKGKPLNSAAAIFFMPSSIFVDRQNGDIYVSDGEGAGSNRRIAVFDASGRFLRQWLPAMETVHCMTIGPDGLVYVCNRGGSKIQVYDKMGALKRTIDVPWTPVTPSPDGRAFGGSTVAIDFSPDGRLLFVINQNSAQIEVIDRESGTIVGSFGRSGTFPGQFNQPHGIAVDGQGNVFVAENRGRRIHKFRIAAR
jgi:DNA-binding beta-propeller fold protein YncE